jgi:hypothetical protein
LVEGLDKTVLLGFWEDFILGIKSGGEMGASSGALGRFENEGFVQVEGVFERGVIAGLIEFVEARARSDAKRGGVRNLLSFAEMRELAGCAPVRALVDPVLGVEARPVRGILFDKTDGANWKVPWHQDVTIAVRNRVEVEGFGPWSMKAGVLHVQPPAAVLERMVTVRIHLDDCPEENGALRVLAGSHRSGKVPEAEVGGWVERGCETVCELKAGGVLVMRPLLLHASSAATRPGHRRVIHFDYANVELPDGMGWAEE